MSALTNSAVLQLGSFSLFAWLGAPPQKGYTMRVFLVGIFLAPLIALGIVSPAQAVQQSLTVQCDPDQGLGAARIVPTHDVGTVDPYEFYVEYTSTTDPGAWYATTLDPDGTFSVSLGDGTLFGPYGSGMGGIGDVEFADKALVSLVDPTTGQYVPGNVPVEFDRSTCGQRPGATFVSLTYEGRSAQLVNQLRVTNNNTFPVQLVCGMYLVILDGGGQMATFPASTEYVSCSAQSLSGVGLETVVVQTLQFQPAATATFDCSGSREIVNYWLNNKKSSVAVTFVPQRALNKVVAAGGTGSSRATSLPSPGSYLTVSAKHPVNGTNVFVARFKVPTTC